MERQDEGQWALRSVWTQKYLGFENTPKDGTPLDALDKPQHWDIEFLPGSEDHDNPRVKYVLATWRRSLLTFALSDRLWVRGTLLVVEFPRETSDWGPLRLWAAREGRNQVWVLEECESRFGVVWRILVANLSFTSRFLNG